MSKANLVTILVILGVLLIAGFFTYQSLNPGENTKNSEAVRSLVGDEESPAQFSDLDGNPVDLNQFAGKIRVVNSWATWCPFCVEELKEFEKLGAAAGEDTVVIAINRKEPAVKQKSFLNKLGTFEHIIFVQDERDRFYESIGGFSMPETVYYDTDGQVAVHKRGAMDVEEMKVHLAATRTNREE